MLLKRQQAEKANEKAGSDKENEGGGDVLGEGEDEDVIF